jgi:hypothetical protein
MPAGRPTKYDTDYHPEHAYKLALLSHTDEEIAAFFEVDVVTFYRWQERHDEFARQSYSGKSRPMLMSWSPSTSAPAATTSRPRRFSASRARSSGPRRPHTSRPIPAQRSTGSRTANPTSGATRSSWRWRITMASPCPSPSCGSTAQHRRSPMRHDACDGIGFPAVALTPDGPSKRSPSRAS